MPAKNVIKIQAPRSYYHIYARGGNKQKIFLEDADYKHFIHLFERYLGDKKVLSSSGVAYSNYREKVELLAFCLMTNHFHLLLYQEEIPYIEKLMRSIMTSYSRYFNLKYKRTGPVFESRYKAVKIDSDAYLQHITRYIHLNPRYWEGYKYSSLRYYRQHKPISWINPRKILSMFSSREEYMNFVANYEDMKNSLAEVKHQLANGS